MELWSKMLGSPGKESGLCIGFWAVSNSRKLTKMHLQNKTTQFFATKVGDWYYNAAKVQAFLTSTAEGIKENGRCWTCACRNYRRFRVRRRATCATAGRSPSGGSSVFGWG